MSSDIARSVIDALRKKVEKLERENAALRERLEDRKSIVRLIRLGPPLKTK